MPLVDGEQLDIPSASAQANGETDVANALPNAGRGGTSSARGDSATTEGASGCEVAPRRFTGQAAPPDTPGRAAGCDGTQGSLVTTPPRAPVQRFVRQQVVAMQASRALPLVTLSLRV